MARPRKTTITIQPPTPARALWRCEWTVPTATGKWRRKTAHYATEAEALAFKAESDAYGAALPAAPAGVELPALRPVVPVRRDGVRTFEQFAAGWLEDVVSRKSAATQASYAGLLKNHVYASLGATLLTDDHLTTEAVINCITTRAKAGVEWGTQKAVIRVVSTCLEWARLKGKLRANPAMRLIKALNDQSGDYEEPEPNPLTAVQAGAFLYWLQTGLVLDAPDRAVDGPRLRGGQLREVGFKEWHPYFATLLGTGMRRGEAAAARWDKAFLDAEPAYLRLDKSYSPALKAAMAAHGKRSDGNKALKARSSRHFRDVELPTVLADVLRELARMRRADALRERRALSPYLFIGPRGARILSDSSAPVRVFDKGMAALGLEAEGHTIHDLRDTFATAHLIESGGRLLPWVSAQLGHKNSSTTLNRYTKWIPQSVGAGYADALPYLRPAAPLAREGGR